jgi:hypothetical protein
MMMKSTFLLIILNSSIVYGFLNSLNKNLALSTPSSSWLKASNLQSVGVTAYKMSQPNTKPPTKTGVERLQKLLEDADKDPKRKPPLYEPGPYQNHILAALAYTIPICDAADLGKYMFEAYPITAEVYNSVYGPLAGVYNGVPFLPFAVFFLMSYISRAPTFPVEIRFHFSQAFIVSLIQFIPSLGFGLLEKAGVPGMGVLYNTGFCFIFAFNDLLFVIYVNVFYYYYFFLY